MGTVASFLNDGSTWKKLERLERERALFAQWLEHWSYEPVVTSSNLVSSMTTFFLLFLPLPETHSLFLTSIHLLAHSHIHSDSLSSSESPSALTPHTHPRHSTLSRTNVCYPLITLLLLLPLPYYTYLPFVSLDASAGSVAGGGGKNIPVKDGVPLPTTADIHPSLPPRQHPGDHPDGMHMDQRSPAGSKCLSSFSFISSPNNHHLINITSMGQEQRMEAVSFS